MREDERVALGHCDAETDEEVVEPARLGEAPAEPDAGERPLRLDPERAGELRVVADLRVGVEGEMVGEQRQVGAEERLQPAAQTAVDDERLVPPEEPVVDDDELRPGGRGPLEQLERAGDAAGDPRHVVGAGDLQPGHAELGVALDLEQLVREGDDLVPAGHGPRLYGRPTKIGRCSA